MAGGRPRKPQADQNLRGNPSQNPEEGAYVPLTGVPKPPEDITASEREAWDRLVEWLTLTGRLEECDGDAILRYCVMWRTFMSAREAIRRHGAVVGGRDGGLVKNPAFQVLNDCAKQLDVLSVKFGLTPKDRQNLGITGATDTKDPFADI